MARKGLNSSTRIVTGLANFGNSLIASGHSDMRLEHSLLQVRSNQPRTRAIIFACMVAVAQLVESRIVIPVVVGSSPISHPKYTKSLQRELQAFSFVALRCRGDE
jgi:hypothetical protein